MTESLPKAATDLHYPGEFALEIDCTAPDYFPKTTCRLFRRSQLGGAPPPVSWVWEGYLARGYLTLLSGQWKVGKSTLLGALLGRMRAGGELAGRAVTAGEAVVVSEEEAGPWWRRMDAHGIGDETGILANPFTVKPAPGQWDDLIEDLYRFQFRRPAALIVLDTIGALLPGNEEANARAMTDALRPLRDLARIGEGAAVLLMHHVRKGPTIAGQAARGTGALPAGVDTVLEYRWAGLPSKANRCRQLLAWSRHAGAPRELYLEQNEAGTDYAVVPAGAGPEDGHGRELLDLLRATPGLTAEEVFAAWPATADRPALRTVRARLTALVSAGRVVRTGRGHPADPFRHRLADGPAAELAAGTPGTGID